MKKFISIITIFSILSILIFSTSIYAAALDTLTVDIDKTTVEPGKQVKLTVNFGQTLGAYTFNFAYDKNIFEYVSVDGGTANDTTDKVIVTYYDSTGGSNPRSNMSITFKAKENITTSNPTEFLVTAEGLANADASVTYDDITTPITKNVTVEPKYEDYKIKLDYTGEIIKEEAKEMEISYSSAMGRYYAHARLIASATTPEGAEVKLLANDTAGLEFDLLENGWGDAQGYEIGGKDVKQTLDVRGVFSKEGKYTITLKLIDRDNSDAVIAEETFDIDVKSEATTQDKEENKTEADNSVEGEAEKEPTELPKTGIDVYAPIALILIVIAGSYVYYIKRK